MVTLRTAVDGLELGGGELEVNASAAALDAERDGLACGEVEHGRRAGDQLFDLGGVGKAEAVEGVADVGVVDGALPSRSGGGCAAVGEIDADLEWWTELGALGRASFAVPFTDPLPARWWREWDAAGATDAAGEPLPGRRSPLGCHDGIVGEARAKTTVDGCGHLEGRFGGTR